MSHFAIDDWPTPVTSFRDAHLAVLEAVLADNSFPWDLCVPSMQARGVYPFPIQWIGWDEGMGTGGAAVNADRMRLRIRPAIDWFQMYAFGTIVAHELAHVADLHWLGNGDPTVHPPEGPPIEADSPRRRALLEASHRPHGGPAPAGWWVSTNHSDRPVEGFSVPFTRLFQSDPAYYEHGIFSNQWADLDQVRALILDDIEVTEPEPPEIIDPDPNDTPPAAYSDEPRIGRLNGQAYMIERRDAVPISEADAQVWEWLGRPTIDDAAMPLVLRACNIGPVK